MLKVIGEKCYYWYLGSSLYFVDLIYNVKVILFEGLKEWVIIDD